MTSLTWEIDYYSYQKLRDKNSGFKNLEKSGRVSTLFLWSIVISSSNYITYVILFKMKISCYMLIKYAKLNEIWLSKCYKWHTWKILVIMLFFMKTKIFIMAVDIISMKTLISHCWFLPTEVFYSKNTFKLWLIRSLY